MSRIWIIGLVAVIGVLAVLLMTPQEQTPQSLRVREVKVIKELLIVLKSVEDAATARSAAPKIEKVAGELRKIAAARKKLGPSAVEYSPEEKSELHESWMELMFEILRIRMNSDLAEPLRKAMKQLGAGQQVNAACLGQGRPGREAGLVPYCSLKCALATGCKLTFSNPSC